MVEWVHSFAFVELTELRDNVETITPPQLWKQEVGALSLFHKLETRGYTGCFQSRLYNRESAGTQ